MLILHDAKPTRADSTLVLPKLLYNSTLPTSFRDSTLFHCPRHLLCVFHPQGAGW